MKASTWLITVVAGALISTTCSPKQSHSVTSQNAAPAPEPAAPHDGWTTDFEKAFEKAKAEKKSVLVEFTGSDWCPLCITMRKNVFSKAEFIEAASKKYVLVELDFPNSDLALKEKNQPYADKYNIESFPAVILFTAEGKEFTRFAAPDYPSTDLFIKHLDEALEKKDLN